MNIVYTTDNKFIDKVATSICSVLENNRFAESITIYVISRDVSEENQGLLKNFVETYKRELIIIEIEQLSSYFSFDFDTSGWNSIVLARLLLDKLLPKSVDRVIYLDGDTLNIAELSSLWATDMGEKIIGGCIEATANEKHRASLSMENIPYINAGVLLIDLKKWRETKTGDSLMMYYRDKKGQLFANDQDVINGSLMNDIYYLEPKYNFYNIYWYYPYRVLSKLMNSSWYYSSEVVADSISNPAIIHYLGEERPWRKGNTHKFSEEYHYYLEKTPWNGTPDDDGWQVYFLAWRGFNFVTRPFPKVRYKIIDVLIPTVLNWRSKKANNK